MTLVGTKGGNFQGLVNCGQISAGQNLALAGSTNPAGGITAPAGLVGTILSQSGGTMSITDALAALSVAGESSFYLAIFWTTSGGTVLNCCYDVQYTIVSATGGVDTVTLAGASSTPTSAKYWASSGAAPSGLPANATPVTVAIAQDITDGISIPCGSGTFNIQQLIATSSQPGLIEWLTTASGNQERLSAFTAGGQYDTWPTAASQVGTLPTGGNGNAWTTNTTVTVLRCYNLGSTLANVGVSSSSANMQAGAILA